MKLVWERDFATVREVYEALRKRRRVAYTTVMTMMNILERKKYLRKTQGDRAYLYRSSQPRHKIIAAMVREFVTRVFNGAAQPMLIHLLEEHLVSRRDLETAASRRRTA